MLFYTCKNCILEKYFYSTMIETIPYQTKHKIRIVTAAALFDGQYATINIMRRVMQSTGGESKW